MAAGSSDRRESTWHYMLAAVGEVPAEGFAGERSKAHDQGEERSRKE